MGHSTVLNNETVGPFELEPPSSHTLYPYPRFAHVAMQCCLNSCRHGEGCLVGRVDLEGVAVTNGRRSFLWLYTTIVALDLWDGRDQVDEVDVQQQSELGFGVVINSLLRRAETSATVSYILTAHWFSHQLPLDTPMKKSSKSVELRNLQSVAKLMTHCKILESYWWTSHYS